MRSPRQARRCCRCTSKCCRTCIAPSTPSRHWASRPGWFSTRRRRWARWKRSPATWTMFWSCRSIPGSGDRLSSRGASPKFVRYERCSIGPVTVPLLSKSTAASTNRTWRASSPPACGSSSPAHRCSTALIRNAQRANSRPRRSPDFPPPPFRGERAPVHFPRARAIRRNGSDGRGLLRQLSRLVRDRANGSPAAERLELPADGSRRLLAAGHRRAVCLQSVGEIRRRNRGPDERRHGVAGSCQIQLRGRAHGRSHDPRDRQHRARDARSRRQTLPASRARARIVLMKALITGAAGFIGSTLAERLLGDGADVVGIDCFTDYYPRQVKERNLQAARAHQRFRFIESRVQDVDLPATLADRTHVFHLAAQAGVRKSWGKDFEIYTVNNIEATQVLLEACTRTKIERLVYASSSSVYGDNRPMPFREDTLPQPLSPYGV